MSTLVIFSCGATLCALPHARVTQVVALPALSRPPTMPPILAGFANVAGEMLAVIEAGALLGVSAEAGLDPLYRHIVFVRDRGAAHMGLLVDRVIDVSSVDASDTRPCPDDTTLNGCVEAMTDYEGEPVHILSADRLLTEAEAARLAELGAAERARLDAWALQ